MIASTFTHGFPGSRIGGSKYVRAYCAACGAPIRVVSVDAAAACSECSPCRPHSGHQKAAHVSDMDDPWIELAIRRMEDSQ